MRSPHHAASLDVVGDAREQVRIAQQLQRRALFVGRELAPRGRLLRCLQLRFVQLLELQKQLAEIALHHLLLDAQLHRSHRHVRGALARRVQLDGVHVEGAALAQHAEGSRAALQGECSSTSRAPATGDRRSAP